jgi:hypothetical protein
VPINIQQPDMTPTPIEPIEQGGMVEGGLDWRPGSPLHERIKTAIMDRCRESRMVMEKRFDTWRKIDRTLTSYVPLDKEEKTLKEKDPRKPVSVVVPVAYATRSTLMTYLRSALLTDPIFRFEGHGPEDALGALKLEMVIDQHCRNFKAGLSLSTLLSDGITYGVGVLGTTWSRKRGKKAIATPDGYYDELLGEFVPTGVVRTSIDTILFEGNDFRNIDPYMYMPDINVPLEHVQRGEFVGWLERTNMMTLLTEEKNGESFNVSLIKRDGETRSILYREAETGRQDRFGGATNANNYTSIVDRIHFYWNLIPRTWGLGPSEYPEKWYFCLAADNTIIRAQPLGLNHDMFPVCVYAPDSDGYESTPISQIEVVYGLQELIDFLVSSHIANVRKAINDMLVVDPMLIRTDDLENPEPGKLIRLRESAWGRGVKDAVMQLNVNDVTRGNMADMAVITDLIQRITGTTDGVQGVMRQSSERRSATEARDTRMSALSRVGSLAIMASLQTMYDLAYMVASQTQQLMTSDVYVKAMGTWQDTLMREYGIMDNRILITPDQILVDYDVIIKDGTMQGAEYADTWMQMFQVIAGNPLLSNTFDIVRVFKHIARLLGAKNINDFVIGGGMINMQVMTEEQMAPAIQAGNLVPVEEIQGADRGTMGGNSAGVVTGP